MYRYIVITLSVLVIFGASGVDAFFGFGPRIDRGDQNLHRADMRQEGRGANSFQQRVKPPKQAIIEANKRRALYIVQGHRVNIANIQNRITNIITLLEKASIDTLGLSSLVVQLENQIAILERLEDEITHRRVTKDKLRNTLHQQRQTMKGIMQTLRSELKKILDFIKS